MPKDLLALTETLTLGDTDWLKCTVSGNSRKIKFATLKSLSLASTGDTEVLVNNGGVLDSSNKWVHRIADGRTAFDTYTSGVNGGGLYTKYTNPVATGNANAEAGLSINAFLDHNGDNNALATNPTFANTIGLKVDMTANAGQNLHAGGTNAKLSIAPLSLYITSKAAGQKFIEIMEAQFYGMGDSFGFSQRINFSNGPIDGDEGTGYNSHSYLLQHEAAETYTIVSVSTPNVNTTITQVVTASKSPQTVTVASTANMAVGQWLCFSHQPSSATLSPRHEAVYITAVGASSVTGIFRANHSNGATCKGCTLIQTSGHNFAGEQRIIVNLSGTSYSTGTITSVTGGSGMVGSGTVWTTGIVGGNADVPGVISLDCDTNDWFNIRAWYQITNVSSNTNLGVLSASVAGDGSYKGRANSDAFGSTVLTPTNYIIRPGCRILALPDNAKLVLEPNSFTWTNGDTLEAAICPYPDVTGFTYRMGTMLPGATCRSFIDCRNAGINTFENGILITQQLIASTNKHTVAWDKGVSIGSANFSFASTSAAKAAMLITGTSDASNSLKFGTTADAPIIGYTLTENGIQFGATGSNPEFVSTAPNTSGNPDTALTRFKFRGYLHMQPSGGGVASYINVYEAFTDNSNYQGMKLKTGPSSVALEAITAGTGQDNIDVMFTPAGTGLVRFGAHSALAGETVTGYITMKDAAGNSRKIAVVS